MEIERRVIDTGKFELRKAANTYTIRGYAAKFDVMSEPLGGFRETITRGAFTSALDDDVRALFNHDPNYVLGRTKSGTARIAQDETGLSYEVDLPDTQFARDLIKSIERGDVTQSSFAFRVAQGGAIWTEDADKQAIRTVNAVSQLYDVSPVTYPAYPDATVGMRSLDAWRKTNQRSIDEKAELIVLIDREIKARGRLLRMIA